MRNGGNLPFLLSRPRPNIGPGHRKAPPQATRPPDRRHRPTPGGPRQPPHGATRRDSPSLGYAGSEPDILRTSAALWRPRPRTIHPAGSVCPWARHRLTRRPRHCANLRKVGLASLTTASPRRPSGGRHVAISLPWATTALRPRAGPVAVPADHAGRRGSRRPDPGPRPSRPPCMLFGRWLPGRIARARAWGESLCNINGPSHRPPPRLYSAWGTGTQ